MMLLQIYFNVLPENAGAFERMYREAYAPALRKQRGYVSSRLLRLFAPQIAAEIEAAPAEFNYQMELAFDTEENRRRWAASEEHGVVWPRAAGMAQAVAWRGYDVVGSD
jgi:antibiotic biosynthesis monooxygenase (ABM) superfamily enzyme